MAEAVSVTLARHLGKQQAHQILAEASARALAERRHLADSLADDGRVTAHLATDELRRLFDPLAYQGMAQAFIDRLIAASRPTQSSGDHAHAGDRG